MVSVIMWGTNARSVLRLDLRTKGHQLLNVGSVWGHAAVSSFHTRYAGVLDLSFCEPRRNLCRFEL